jgi:hypothetical protein
LGGGFQGDGQEERLFDVGPSPSANLHTSRATISRSTTMFSTRASWSARSRRWLVRGFYFAMARGTHGAPQKIITAHLMERVDMT